MSSVQRQLTVVVGGQTYTLAGDQLVEVLRRSRITRVPHGPPALLGVSNLRGAVLPIVSLARLMGSAPGSEERVVVLDHSGAVGLLVDAVLRLDESDVGPTGQPIDIAALLESGFKRQAAGTANRQQHNAVSAPAETVAAQRVLIAFVVSGQTFALPLDAVIAVLRLPETLTLVADADAAVLGLANVRDRALPVISLAALLGFANAGNNSAGRRVLVVEHEGAQVGLVADAIETILRLDEAAIDMVPPILQRGRGQAELDAIGRQGGGRPLVSILSVPRLFANAAVEATVMATSNEANRVADAHITQRQEQFVVFDLGEERYGLPIAAVQEVLRLPESVTRLPNGPSFVSGIINLRGRPVPIIDQRQRFDAPAAADAVQPRVIVVTVGTLTAGFVVDAVSEILSVAADSLAVTPSLSSEGSAVFNRVANLGADGGLILLIDPQELLSRAEQDVIADIAARQDAAGTA
ncbi:CheW protein [Devosia sp. YR412]|uniref:chemotaxis protein CheW n=1 Tax=Devosia sp. YR412 TaxID=1881030 RepID=UPI0008D28788|nr:chemotaxis protein CheW [Devosia sp. YR412]SEQ09614.1 CheW protein [Devosia sp. YR412]